MRSYDRHSDHKLLAKARDGDVRAFETFYRRHVDAIAVYLRRRVTTGEVAADLLAEVFAAVVVSLSRRSTPPDEPRAWLFGIARNKLADSRRHSKVQDAARLALTLEPLEFDDSDIAALDALAADDAEVIRLLGELPPGQRDAVEARVIAEKDYPAIAAELGVSDMVVRQRVSRGLATLRSRMEQP